MSEPNYIQWLTLRNVRIVTNSTAVSWLKVQCLLFLLCSLNATKGHHLTKDVNTDHNKLLYTRLIWSFFGENSGKSQQDVSSGDLESLHQISLQLIVKTLKCEHVSLLVAEEKSGEHQSYEEISSGDHECLLKMSRQSPLRLMNFSFVLYVFHIALHTSIIWNTYCNTCISLWWKGNNTVCIKWI